MESRPVYVVADWWSRALSVVSLALAVGAVIYLSMNKRQLDQLPVQMRNELGSQFAEQTKDNEQKQAELQTQYETLMKSFNDRLAQQWSDQLGRGLEKFQQDADQLLQKIELSESQATEKRQQAFREQLESLAATAAPESAESAAAANDKNPQPNANPAAALAVLQLADTRLRPTGGDGTLIRIENSSAEDALITRVRFKPEADFQVTANEGDVSIMKGAESVVTLAFNSSDNTSTKPGMHGLYDRSVATPIRVPAGGQVTFRVMIENPTHTGWGLTGKLVVDYNGQDPLVVNAARVVFQPVAAEVSTADPALDAAG